MKAPSYHNNNHWFCGNIVGNIKLSSLKNIADYIILSNKKKRLRGKES